MMGRTGEFTDYEQFFSARKAGIFVGAALFAVAVIIVVVSSIYQAIVRRCCPSKKDNPNKIEEAVPTKVEETRRSFENPVYSQDIKEKQDINVRISTADGYLSIENHEYENATHLKKRTESDADTDIDYENLKDKKIDPPKEKKKPPKENKTTKMEKANIQKDNDMNGVEETIETYDRPQAPKSIKKRTLEHVEDEDEDAPDYDVPKTFTEDDEETQDYDVPKSFTE
ncbi:SUN domain-containing protein 2-like [Mytilus edulis]|uniref:SUN domain-containing protein 2-like n=1 Tax=Mytilus edulis TaxID=6550 RepID=UPI0039EEC82D